MKQTAVAVLAIATLIGTPFFASAHERQLFNIGGTDYIFVVGSLGEPIVVDDKTGIELRVKKADPKAPTDANALGAIPVVDLEKTLKVELIAGDKKTTLDILPAYKDPGAYKNTFFPTIATTYTYRFFGTINDTPVDLSFTCNPAGHVAAPEDTTEVPLGDGVVRKFKAGQFGCPLTKEELGFPEPTMTMVGLHEDAEHHMSGIMTALNERGSSGAALAFGLLGLVMGALALWKSRAPKV